MSGAVEQPLELGLADIRAMPRRTVPVTLECAGTGRARLTPRPLSQPWLVEAVGTAEWTGEVENNYARSLTLADAGRQERANVSK